MKKNARGSRLGFGWIVVSVVWFLLNGSNIQAAYVITIQGQRVDGTDIRAKSDGEIVLTTPQGTRTFYKGQYTRAVADKPAEFDRVKGLVDNKNYEEAVKILEDIVLKYRYLEWDLQALALLPQVYTKKGDYKTAVEAYEKLFASSAKSKEDPEIQWAYRQTLLNAGLYDKLEPMLKTLISEGSRSDAARAQIMRGDIKAAQNQLEPALFDYLRTVVLFESEKEWQPEALFKTAGVMEQLRDARAKEFYKKILDEYPSSPYADEARSKM